MYQCPAFHPVLPLQPRSLGSLHLYDQYCERPLTRRLQRRQHGHPVQPRVPPQAKLLAPSERRSIPDAVQNLTCGLAASVLALAISHVGDARIVDGHVQAERPPAQYAQNVLHELLVPDACAEVTAEAPPVETAEQTAKKAAAETKRLRKLSRKNTRAAGKVAQMFSLARRSASAGDLDGALATYDEIIAMDGEFAPAYSNRANIYVAKRRNAEALADYDRALELAPLDGDAWVVYVNRGCTRLAMGADPYVALEDMNRAFDLRGEDAVILSNRAGVWEMLGKYDNAIRDYQAALKSNDVQPFWNRYGLVLFQRNKSYEALSILRRVATRFDVGDVHAALAIVYFDRGELAEAETEWSKVDRPKSYESRAFLEGDRKWPPRAIDAMDKFRHLKE